MKNAKKKRRGSVNGRSKLCDDSIREIRGFYNEGASQIELAQMFRVTRSTVHRIVKRKTWSHVE